jgi:hypothetical protein
MTTPAGTATVDGIDVDAVAAAVRACPAVDDLDGGRLGGVATYLPGRRVPGIRLDGDRIEVHVRGLWNQPAALIASQIRGVLATLAAGKVIDVVLADIAEPGTAGTQLQAPGARAATVAPAAPTDGTVEGWTMPSASDEPSGGSSSGSTIQTAAEIRPSS